jgi:glycosyltransferase involved in cell wall biosynthesis
VLDTILSINPQSFEGILKLILIISFLIQIFYWLFFYFRIAFIKNSETSIEEKGISVIICAKNEAENLKNFLPKFLNQKYSNFELIIVNDNSSDNTEEILVNFKKEYKNLYFTNIESEQIVNHGKKIPLSIGIKAAKNEILVMSDADCYPVSEEWLSEINNSYTENTEIVLGYGGYDNSNGLLNKIIRFDAMFIGLQYMTFAKAGIPYMGTGRNLSYKKSLYYKMKGFSSHYHIISGDDDLFVNTASDKKNTISLISSKSYTRSVSKTTLGDFIKQKRRHLSTGKFYKFWHKTILGTEIFSRFLFYSSLIVLSILLPDSYILLYLFALRFIIQSIITKIASDKFKEKGIAYFTLFLDILLPLLNLWILFTGIFINRRIKRGWK